MKAMFSQRHKKTVKESNLIKQNLRLPSLLRHTIERIFVDLES